MKPQGMGSWPDEFVKRVERLPLEQQQALAEGPRPEPEQCRVCDVLRWPGYASGGYGPGWEDHKDANWLLNWHGIDPVRCGSIYTAALLLTSPRPSDQPVGGVEEAVEVLAEAMSSGEFVSRVAATLSGSSGFNTYMQMPAHRRYELESQVRTTIKAAFATAKEPWLRSRVLAAIQPFLARQGEGVAEQVEAAVGALYSHCVHDENCGIPNPGDPDQSNRCICGVESARERLEDLICGVNRA